VTTTTADLEFDSAAETVRTIQKNGGAVADYKSYLDIKQWTTIPAGGSRVYKITNDDGSGQSSAQNDVIMTIRLAGGDGTIYRATFNNSGNPTYEAPTGQFVPVPEVSGDVMVTNIGNAPAKIVTEVTGNFPNGFAVQDMNTGRYCLIDGAVNATVTPVVMDHHSGRVTQGSTDLTNRLTTREWTVLKGGEAAVFHLEDFETGTDTRLTVRIKSRWR
jgi:hypothetical protein